MRFLNDACRFQIADWSGNTYTDRRYANKYTSQIGAGGSQYAYFHEEDENSFQLVDTSRSVRGAYGRGRFFRGRGQFGAQNRLNPGPLQVLSKAQKNKER